MRSLWAISFILLSGWLSAQEFQMRHYGVNEGLPGSQVYDIQQSPTGDIWIATDLGASRYNGYEFQTYTGEDGLADNSIVKMAINDSGVVWMLGFNRKLSWVKDSAYSFEKNSTLLEKLGTHQVTSIGFNREDQLLLGVQNGSDRSGYLLHVNSWETTSSAPGVSWDSEALVFGGSFQDSLFEPLKPGAGLPLNTTGKEMIRKVSYDAERSCWYVLTRNALWKVASNGDLKQLTLGSKTTGALMQDHFGNLWIGTYHGLFVTHPDRWGQKTRVLPQNAVSALCRDKRNGIWIGTYSDGVYHLKNLYMTHFRNIQGIEDPDVKRIQTSDGDIYFSDTRNVLYQLQYRHWITAGAKLFLQSESPINAIYRDQGKDFLLCNTTSTREPFSSPLTGLCINPGRTAGEYWVGKIYSFAYYQGQKETFNSAEIGFQERVNCLHYDSESDRLWLGTLSGLYTYDGDSVSLFPGSQDIRIDEMLWTGNRLLLATQGKGIGIVEEEELQFIGKAEGLPTSFVRDLKMYGDHLLAATNKGLVVWRDSVERILDLSDGLISNEINCLAQSGNNLFIGTRKGLTVLDLEYLGLPSSNLAVEAQFNTGDQWRDQVSTLRLPPSENSISFRLLTRDFRIEDAIRYRYRLEPDTSWNYSTQQDISYSALSAGSYVFVAAAQNEAGEWSQEPVRIPFVVEQPFWRSWWFIGLMALILAALVRLIIQRQVNKVRKENFLQNQLNSLKIKALSAQMNPHFIFNSLNSIQNFLIENDLKRSNKYLTKFARLMRLVLNNSDKTFSPFREVVHSLELYMELERIRFNEQFDFSIQINPNVEADSIKIPAMLMQPFVENAILHGILPAQRKGEITVSISRAGEHVLHCTIEDNGVGRDFHAGRQSKKFKSQGLRITRERLEAFQAIFDDEFHYNIVDLKNEAGEPIGTRVELLVPCR